MAKKRKGSSQSSTLHDFFGKPGNASKKSKITKKSRKVSVNPKSLAVNAADIIVIDSDEDDASTGSALVIDIDSASDVEFVQGSSIPRKYSGLKSEPHDSTVPPMQRQAVGPPITCDIEDPFGEPSLLLPESYVATNILASADDGFGQPYLLVSPAGNASISLPDPDSPDTALDPRDSLPHPQSDITNGTTSSIPAFIDPVVEDEVWGTGDDEIEAVEDELGFELKDEYLDIAEVDVDVDLTLDDDTDAVITESSDEVCPVCGILLQALRGLVRFVASAWNVHGD